MTPDQLVEIVARAIALAKEGSSINWRDYERAAHGAIRAIFAATREPSEEMDIKGDTLLDEGCDSSSEIWRAMHDQRVKEVMK